MRRANAVDVVADPPSGSDRRSARRTCGSKRAGRQAPPRSAARPSAVVSRCATARPMWPGAEDEERVPPRAAQRRSAKGPTSGLACVLASGPSSAATPREMAAVSLPAWKHVKSGRSRHAIGPHSRTPALQRRVVDDVDGALVVGRALAVPREVAEVAAGGEERRHARHLGDGVGVLQPLERLDHQDEHDVVVDRSGGSRRARRPTCWRRRPGRRRCCAGRAAGSRSSCAPRSPLPPCRPSARR